MRPFADAYDSIPRKFLSLCIGHAACKDPFAQDAWTAYETWRAGQEHPNNESSRSTQRVIDIGAFLLDGPYKDLSILTPLYSMHKAEKLNLYLTSHKQNAHFFIQKKFIIETAARQFIIIGQKNPTMFSHQITPCLSSPEATGLIALIFLGFINPLNAHNCPTLTEKGQVVILNPTPIDRLRKEALIDSRLGQLFFDKALRLPRKLCLTALVKTLCPPLVQKDVEEREKREYRKGMYYSIKMVTFYAVSCYAALILSTPTYETIPIKLGLVGLTSAKLLLYAMHAFNVHQAYMASMQRENGLPRIKEYLKDSPS